MGQKRVAVLLIVINLAVIVVLSLFAYQKYQKLAQHSAAHQVIEQRAAQQLRESIAEIETLLYKGQFAASPEVAVTVGTRLYGRAAEAAVALAQLPVPPETAAPKILFLDDVSALARRMVRYGPIAFEAVSVFAETPVRPAISAENALDRAAAFMALSPGIFSHIGSDDTHRFQARVDGGILTVEVGRAYGQVHRAENSRRVPRTQKSPEEGLALAQAAVRRSGHDHMEPRYQKVRDNTVIADFFYVRDGVVFYPDHVRVSVGLDNGRVIGFQTSERLSRPDLRVTPTPNISPEGAMDAIPTGLAIKGYDLAVIEIYGTELFCYAFHCRAEDGQGFMVYVSADSGQQLDLRLLREDVMGFGVYFD